MCTENPIFVDTTDPITVEINNGEVTDIDISRYIFNNQNGEYGDPANDPSGNCPVMYDIDSNFNNNAPFAVVNDPTQGLVELSPSFSSSADLSITY